MSISARKGRDASASPVSVSPSAAAPLSVPLPQAAGECDCAEGDGSVDWTSGRFVVAHDEYMRFTAVVLTPRRDMCEMAIAIAISTRFLDLHVNLILEQLVRSPARKI